MSNENNTGNRQYKNDARLLCSGIAVKLMAVSGPCRKHSAKRMVQVTNRLVRGLGTL